MLLFLLILLLALDSAPIITTFTTATATKDKATTINSSATTITASTTTATTKTKGIKAKCEISKLYGKRSKYITPAQVVKRTYQKCFKNG